MDNPSWRVVARPASSRRTLADSDSVSSIGSPQSGAMVAVPVNRNLTPQFSAMSLDDSQSQSPMSSPTRSTASPDQQSIQGLPSELYNLHQIISKQPGLHPSSANSILSSAANIIMTNTEHLRKVQKDASQQTIQLLSSRAENKRISDELTGLQKKIEEASKAIQNISADRDYYERSYINVAATLESSQLSHKLSEERYNKVITELQGTNNCLNQRLTLLEEQLSGKRSTCPSSSSEDHSSVIALNQYHGQLKLDNARKSLSRMHHLKPAETISLLTALPTGKPTRNVNSWVDQTFGSHKDSSLAAGSRSERYYPSRSAYGTDSNHVLPSNTSRGSVISAQQSERNKFATDLKEAVHNVFALINGWTESYANIPDDANDRKILKASDGELWAYMMSLCAQQRYDAYSHVRVLLSEVSSRHWFVMRMAVEYIKNNMWVPVVFEGFSETTDTSLRQLVRTRTEMKAMNMADRHALVTTQAEIINSIINDEQFPSFRAKCLNHHTKQIRTILGPVLNVNVCRADAGRDIGVFVAKAWEVAITMLTSDCSFQMHYPDTQGRFHPSYMINIDTKYQDQNPRELHLGQARVRLFVTPLITMRNDGGKAITAKSVQMARVLLT